MTNPALAAAEAMARAIAKLPDFAFATQRGAQLTEAQIASYVPGRVVVEPGFVSLSPVPSRTFGGNVRFIVISPEGKDISAMSATPDEPEIVISFGASFFVASRTYDPQLGCVVIVLIGLVRDGQGGVIPLSPAALSHGLAAAEQFLGWIKTAPAHDQRRIDSDRFYGPIGQFPEELDNPFSQISGRPGGVQGLINDINASTNGHG